VACTRLDGWTVVYTVHAGEQLELVARVLEAHRSEIFICQLMLSTGGLDLQAVNHKATD
jgi:hypothetical protein